MPYKEDRIAKINGQMAESTGQQLPWLTTVRSLDNQISLVGPWWDLEWLGIRGGVYKGSLGDLIKIYTSPLGVGQFPIPADFKEIVKKGRRALGDLIKKSLAERDWESLFSMADGPLHLLFFVGNVHLMQDAEYWQLLGDLWTDCDIVGPNQRVWLTLFKLQRNDRYKLMLEDERLKFDALPDEVRLYRSAGIEYARGMSWTTNLDVAAYFTKRHPVRHNLLRH